MPVGSSIGFFGVTALVVFVTRIGPNQGKKSAKYLAQRGLACIFAPLQTVDCGAVGKQGCRAGIIKGTARSKGRTHAGRTGRGLRTLDHQFAHVDPLMTVVDRTADFFSGIVVEFAGFLILF